MGLAVKARQLGNLHNAFPGLLQKLRASLIGYCSGTL